MAGQQWGFASAGTGTGELILRRNSIACATYGDRYTSELDEVGENLPDDPTLLCRSSEIEYHIVPTEDLAETQRLLIPVKLLTGLSTGDLRYKVFLRNSATSHTLYSDEFSVTPGSETISSFDLTNFSTDDLGAVDYLGIVFTSDLALASDLSKDGGATQILQIGAITRPGNLTPELPVYYRFGEMLDSTDPSKLFNVIYSDGSDPSGNITPTTRQAVGVLTLPARVNDGVLPGTPIAGWFPLYRFGDYPDGYGRLIGLFRWGDTGDNFEPGGDSDKGAEPYFAARANPYIKITYTATAGDAGTVIYDNTPASWLLYAPLYEPGRDAPPEHIRDLCLWRGRLWCLAGEGRRSELYASWLLSADTNAGLYFTKVQPPNDPSQSTKGFYTHVGTEGVDKALRLIPMDGALLIAMERGSPYLLEGDDPSNFSLNRYEASSRALNLSAGNAITVWRNVCVYLSPDGLVALSPLGGQDRNLSLLLAADLTPGLLNTSQGGNALTAAGYAGCSLWTHNDCLYLAAPTGAGTSNSVLYRYDPRQNGGQGAWTRWLEGNVTGGAVVDGSGDQNRHFVAGLDGMLSRYVPNAGDKATSGASETAIAFALRTRSYRGEGGLPVLSAQRFVLVVENGAESVVLTLGITGDVAGAAWSQSYTLGVAGGENRINLRPQRVRGRKLYATVSGSVTKRLTLSTLVLQASSGSQRLA